MEKGTFADTLIVIDMQNDFITGSLGTPEAREIVPKVAEKVKAYKRVGKDVYFTRDTHDTDYLNTKEGIKLLVPHCYAGTHGWEIESHLDTEGCKFIGKKAFGTIGWKDYSLGNVELVGVCTDICVVSNALILKAIFPEYEITVDADCCAGTTPEMHRKALDVMRSCQVNVIGR